MIISGVIISYYTSKPALPFQAWSAIGVAHKRLNGCRCIALLAVSVEKQRQNDDHQSQRKNTKRHAMFGRSQRLYSSTH
jgi:hypothetical protein